MVSIDEKLYLAKGEERKCYIHPQDSSKIVKLEYSNATGRNQNDLDIYYHEYLARKKVSFKHMAKYYGVVNTNKGSGVVFERVVDYNGGLFNI